jgi:hypothetical protein
MSLNTVRSPSMIQAKVVEAGGHKPPQDRPVLEDWGRWNEEIPVCGSTLRRNGKQYKVKAVPVPFFGKPVTYNGKPTSDAPEHVIYLEEVN